MLVLAALALPVRSQTAEQLKRASELFKQANGDYSAGRNDAAIAGYTEYLKIRPTASTGWYNRGLAYMQKADAAMSQTDYERAEADFSQAIKLDPKDAEFWLNRGHVRSRLMSIDFANKLPQAIADYTQAIKLNPKLSGAYTGRGRVYEESNQHAKALPDLNKALQLDPNDYVALYTRGKVYGYTKNYPAARADLEKALRLYPNYAQARSFLSFVNDEARKASATKSTPASGANPAPPITSLAELYKKAEAAEKAGDHPQVLILSARSLELIPMNGESLTANDLETSVYLTLLRMRAKAYSSLGQHAKSDDEYSSHGLASVRNMSRYLKSANATLRADKLGSSGGWIMAKIEAFKGVQVCNAGIVAGREWMDVVERLRPKDTLTGIRAGLMFAGIKDMCAASYMVYGDYQANQDGDKAMLNKGLNDALSSYNTAITFTPRDPRPYAGRAKIYRKLGRNDLAAADEQKARELPTPK